MLKLLPLFSYDTPHSIFAARKILADKPNFVAVEVPEEFQPILDRFASGRLGEGGLVSAFSGRGVPKGALDRGKKLLFGKSEPNYLLPDFGSPGHSIEYIAIAAKKVGAKLVAVDMTFASAETAIDGMLVHTKKGRRAAIERAKKSLGAPDRGLSTFFEFVYSPFYFFELLIGHRPNRDPPGKHPSGCPICTAGIYWERSFYEAYALFTNLFHPIGEAKYVPAMKYFETLRERKIARKIARILINWKIAYPKKPEPRVLAITHLWHSREVKRRLAQMGFQPAYI